MSTGRRIDDQSDNPEPLEDGRGGGRVSEGGPPSDPFDPPMSDMTVAFELESLDALAAPKAAIEDALEWSRHVGIVSQEPQYVVREYMQDLGVHEYPVFYTWVSKRRSLASFRTEQDTARYVLVGTTADAAAIAEEVNWEYLPVETAAEKAEWEL